MKKIILIIGAPGSGKTSTSRKVVEQLDNVSHYSMGEIFRKEIKMNTLVGKKIEVFLKKGITVPLNIAISAIINVINISLIKNIIIDGFPRDIEQLNAFNNFIDNQNKIDLLGLIEIRVSTKIAKNRILNRNRGVDDNEEVFVNRMQYYKKYKNKIVDTYKTKNKFFEIDGNKSFDNAVNQLNNLIINLFTL